MSAANQMPEKLAFDWAMQRELAATQFKAEGFPTRKKEAWKYTSLSNLPQNYREAAKRTEQGLSAKQCWSDEHYKLSIVDGYVHALESNLPETIVLELSDLNNPKEVEQLFFAEQIAHESDFERAGHIALNRAVSQQAVIMRIPQVMPAETIIEIHHVVSEAGEECSSFPQVWLVMEQASQFTLVERFYSMGDVELSHMQNAVVNIVLEEGAKLTHIRSQDLPEGVTHLYNAHVDMQENSQYQAFSLMSGASLSRQEVQVHLLGEGAHCDQQGIILGNGKQHHDAYLPVYHLAPGCYSNQNFRQLLDGESKGVFYGRVEVPQTSPRTEAHQMNKNLLLSEAAQVFTRPELDILTDDVVCSHGATTGALDEQALYYLQARGISYPQARALLTKGYAAELIDSVKNETVREAILQQAISVMGGKGSA